MIINSQLMHVQNYTLFMNQPRKHGKMILFFLKTTQKANVFFINMQKKKEGEAQASPSRAL